MARPADVAATGPAVTVELLYFDGCPNYQAYLPRLRALLPDAAELLPRRISTDEDAQRNRFLGSPTVRVKGRDIEPEADRRTEYGLQCRLYRTPSGWSGTPPDEWVLNALRRPRPHSNVSVPSARRPDHGQPADTLRSGGRMCRS